MYTIIMGATLWTVLPAHSFNPVQCSPPHRVSSYRYKFTYARQRGTVARPYQFQVNKARLSHGTIGPQLPRIAIGQSALFMNRHRGLASGGSGGNSLRASANWPRGGQAASAF